MNKTALFIFGLAITSSLFAQKSKKDIGQFVKRENPFYQEIKKGINDFETEQNKNPKKSFKMNFEGKEIPKSIDEFTTVWCNSPISQGRTGTCWCFSTSSYFESEVFRQTKKEIKLSELYTVYWEYIEKSKEYVKTRGASFFGEGSETNAVIRMMKQYGAMPESAFNGMQNGQKFHDHLALFNEMEQYLHSIKQNNAWNEQVAIETIKSILNHYIGTPPTDFKVDGKTFNPKNYLKDVLQLNLDDYVNFMSLKQSPYYSKALYNVPDNWWNSTDFNNVPLNDFMSILKSAVKNNFSIVIGGDVSETGYSPQNDVAMIPSYDIPSDYINEDARQLRFSNGATTDDHAIHIIGYKENKNGFWFLIKDSGSGARNGKNAGYYFYHEDFVKLKTMTFTIHKDAVKNVLKKMK